MSASLALEPPRGGIAPLPLMALAVRPSMPCAMRGAQAALSPSLGAPATPAVWQAVQTCVKSAGAAPASALAAVGVAVGVAVAVTTGGLPGTAVGTDAAALAAATTPDAGAAGAAGSGNLAPPLSAM